jgi:LacI family transcriptional regulator
MLCVVVRRNVSIDDVVGRSRRGAPIAVGQMPNGVVAERLLEVAEERRWQLVGLTEYRGQLPSNLSVRGALVTGASGSPLVVDLLQRGIPTVRIGRMPGGDDAGLPTVVADRGAAGRLAADHFAARGFRHLAYIAHPWWKYNRLMFRGLVARGQELGCEVHLRRMHGERPEYARNSPEQWRYQQVDFTESLRRFPKPVGLLASSDITAGRYCRWIVEAGWRVPEDVAVLGVGDDRFLCESAPVPTSSVAYDWRSITDTAVELLVRHMAGERLASATVRVEPRGVVTRRSTDVLAASDDNVARALRHMWDHLDQALTVDQIARQVQVSRRTLERAFERELGRGVFAEFQRRRLEKAREMLRQTDLRVADIAGRLGFSSQNYFGQVFRKMFGISPVRYRAQGRAE